MKANSSGNRHGGTAHSYRHEIEDREERDDDLLSPARPVVEQLGYERELFVYHQQDLARRALHLGSPGAARAALRALHAVDFADSKRATELLRTLRDPTAPQDEVTYALRALVLLRPIGVDDRPRLRSVEIAALVRDDVPFGDE